jgi:hypothetical protein
MTSLHNNSLHNRHSHVSDDNRDNSIVLPRDLQDVKHLTGVEKASIYESG